MQTKITMDNQDPESKEIFEKIFKSILEFQKEFNTEKKCLSYLENKRWNNSPFCTFCESTNVHRLKGQKAFKCNNCKHKFSVTSNSAYANTKVPLTKWFLATYLLSLYEELPSNKLAKCLQISAKSANHLKNKLVSNL